MKFADRNILITGGAGDIGFAVAQRFSAEGGGTAQTYVADVTDIASIKEMVQEIEKDGLRIDMLLNNAGYQGDFKKVITINLIGAFNVLWIVSEHMVRNGGGTIVNSASMAGVDGLRNMIGYGAGRFGVVGMTQTASKDLAPYNIRVNAISPAFMGPGYMWDRQVQLQAEADSQYFDRDPKVGAQQMIGSVPMRRYGHITEIPGIGVNVPISGGIS